MLVQQILSAKASQQIITLSPEALVSEAVITLAQHRIGALVISANGSHIDGILSERDIVRQLALEGGGVLERPVSSLMTRQIVTCSPSDSAHQVVEKMTKGRFRHMPVVEGGLMVGLISIGDVVKWRLDELVMEKRALEGMITGY